MSNPVGAALAFIAVCSALLLLFEVPPLRRLARLVVLVVPGAALAYTFATTREPADVPQEAQPPMKDHRAGPPVAEASRSPMPHPGPAKVAHEVVSAPRFAGPRLPEKIAPPVEPAQPPAPAPPPAPEPAPPPHEVPVKPARLEEPAAATPVKAETAEVAKPSPAVTADQQHLAAALATEVETRRRLELELTREQAAHALTRAAFESKAAALQKALGAGPVPKTPAQPASGTAAPGTKAASASLPNSPGTSTGAGDPTAKSSPDARLAAAPAAPPSPGALDPHAKADPAETPRQSVSTTPTKPAEAAQAPLALPAVAALRQKMDAGGVLASASVRRLPSGEMVAGRGGSYYLVTLINAATQKRFRFVAERYVLADKDAELATAFEKLLEEVAGPLPAGSVAAYVQANAGNRPLSGPRNLSATRSALARIAYLPRRPGDDGYWSKAVEQAVQGTFQHGDLPVLRAGNVREILARATGSHKVTIEVLAGRLLEPGDEAANTFDLILCVTWPG